MKRALAAGLLSCVLAAYAQTPPEPVAPAGTRPAAAPAPDSAQNPPPAAAPAAQGTDIATEPPPQPPKAAAAPRTPPPKPPAPAAPAAGENTHDAELAALRAEVNRLQSELDAERAAALPAPEESAPGAQPGRSLWEWLLVTALLALTAGFFLGWRLLDRRIRRKYGGLRIY
ncbi:MAG TPA: hypothetical protein VEU78_08145 [Steroidobacteraceae bacterium]|nr:hypothetical protein [Steroidobacteraceae bacterium]